jgi:hypothetical protein
MLGMIPVAVSALAAEASPPQAHIQGYDVNTFDSHFAGDLDMQDTRKPGYDWYLGKWFGWPAADPATLAIKDDGLTISGMHHPANYTIGSAAELAHDGSGQWVGTAFGGGGYFEAELKFDPANVVDAGGHGLPAWWMEPVEAMTYPVQTQWAAQKPGYDHFVEIDVFEYNMWETVPVASYGGTVHDWYGISKITCPGQQFCDANNQGKRTRYNNNEIVPPKGTDYRDFHKFGILWVPATPTTKGYLQYYFDGRPTRDKVMWDQYTDQPPPPGTAPWTFGIADREHYALILGTGDNKPMTVRSVKVWQKSSSGNITR